MKLTGQERGDLNKLILKYFDYFTLTQFLSETFDRKFLSEVPPAADFDFQVFRLTEKVNDRLWINEFIGAFVKSLPAAEDVTDFAFKCGVIVNSYNEKPDQWLPSNGLQNLINSDPGINPKFFIEGLAKTQRCVCLIEINKNGKLESGTGFLIGEDKILTAYHVVKDLVDEVISSDDITCKFDYVASNDGSYIHSTDVQLEKETVIAYSPYCNFDTNGTDSVEVDWPNDHYDYAVLKLNRKIGTEKIGITYAKGGAQDVKRGWIEFPKQFDKPSLKSSVIILQHPNKMPLQMGIGLSKVIGTDDNYNRVRYDVNTMPGSSGSPCFDEKFNLIALHNMGDPSRNPKYNQGVITEKILSDLTKKKIML
jgi:V8-like Glu-specific endopeptidase